MNRKVYKKIRSRAKDILYEWVLSLTPEEDKDKINPRNLNDFLPVDGHISMNTGDRISFYTKRWAIINTKRLFKKGYDLNQITMRDLELAQRKR